MEIISYVGAASAVRREPKSFHFAKPNIRMPQITAKRFRAKRHTAKTDVLALQKSRVAAAFNPLWLTRATFYKWLIPTVAICILVPMTVFRVAEYSESHANPVVFPLPPETETEFLNRAMAQFAIERNDDAFDENGNVLADDGTILTAASVGVGKAVSFTQYKVTAGDTISGIAKKFGLGNISTLIAVNDIDNVRALRSGQKLRVPNQDGLVHRVAKGESVNSISVKYHVSVEEILDVNDIETMALQVGQELFIPGAKMDAKALRQAMGELCDHIRGSRRDQHKIGSVRHGDMLHTVLEVPVKGIHQRLLPRELLEGDRRHEFCGVLRHEHLHVGMLLYEG